MNGKTRNFCGRTRREFLWQAGGGFAGVAMASLLGDDGFFDRQTVAADGITSWKTPLVPKNPSFGAKAKSVIFLFMYGGPSHIDTFDYKPDMKGMDNKTVKVKKNLWTRWAQESRPYCRAALEFQTVRSVRQVDLRFVSTAGHSGRQHCLSAFDDC